MKKMVWKALEKIDGYEPGDVVPESKAAVWNIMYEVSPVEFEEGQKAPDKKPKKEKKRASDKEADSLFSELFAQELLDIEGIGVSTMKDIIEVYPLRTSLTNAIELSQRLPFRDDIAEKLERHFK